MERERMTPGLFTLWTDKTGQTVTVIKVNDDIVTARLLGDPKSMFQQAISAWYKNFKRKTKEPNPPRTSKPRRHWSDLRTK